MSAGVNDLMLGSTVPLSRMNQLLKKNKWGLSLFDVGGKEAGLKCDQSLVPLVNLVDSIKYYLPKYYV